MFRDSIEAFLYVIEGGRGIKGVKSDRGYLRNGIKHCRVQVECNDGAAYGIDAYGDEAERLFAEASKYVNRSECIITV
jgi:hypothetical protein